MAHARDMGLVGLYGVESEVIGSVWDWRRVCGANRELIGSIGTWVVSMAVGRNCVTLEGELWGLYGAGQGLLCLYGVG